MSRAGVDHDLDVVGVGKGFEVGGAVIRNVTEEESIRCDGIPFYETD